MSGWLRKQLGHDASPLVQFIKYGIAGGAATATHILVFFLAGWFLFPCLTQDDIVVRLFGLTVPAADLTETRRAFHALYCSTIGFFFSNALCYLLNRWFVFKPGRHHWMVELLLFFAASGFSLLVGSTVQTVLIRQFGFQTSVSFAANIVASLLINFVARKFFIFKG